MSRQIEIDPNQDWPAHIQMFLDQIEAQYPHSKWGLPHKLEFDKAGCVQAELRAGQDQLWLRWSENEVIELPAVEDTRIPLTSTFERRQLPEGHSVLNHRPGKRLVLLEACSRKPKILKAFRKNHSFAMFERYEAAHAAFAGRGVYTPEVIEWKEDLDTLVMVYETGEPLQFSSDAIDLFHVLGEALRQFQDCDITLDAKLFTSSDELGVIDRRMARMTQAGFEPPAGWQELRQRLAEAETSLPPAEIGLCHRDLYDKQFVKHLNFITLLDFDLMCRADVTLDPANFLAHMVLRNLQGAQGATQRGIDLCGKRFLQGLERNESAGFWDRLRFYQATTFCRLALVYRVRPTSLPLVAQLTRMGHRCLDDLDRIRGG